MPIITFYSTDNKETGQTVSMAALITYMSIQHNYKIIGISTSFRDETLENCFWNKAEEKKKRVRILADTTIDSGMDGLVRVIKSKKDTRNIIKDYAKVVFNGRLDILTSLRTKLYSEYKNMAPLYVNVLEMAKNEYDLVFVDLSKRVPENIRKQILENSDVIVVNINQGIKSINSFLKEKEENVIFQKQNVMLTIGKYDRFSKYNDKNIARYLREKDLLSVIPYNTLFFEACSSGEITDYFLKLRNIDKTDRNAFFAKEIKNMTNNLIYKLQELELQS